MQELRCHELALHTTFLYSRRLGQEKEEHRDYYGLLLIQILDSFRFSDSTKISILAVNPIPILILTMVLIHRLILILISIPIVILKLIWILIVILTLSLTRILCELSDIRCDSDCLLLVLILTVILILTSALGLLVILVLI